MDAARQTAEISQAAREADERYRQLDQLRMIHRLVQQIRSEVSKAVIAGGPAAEPRPTWRFLHQDELGHSLVGAVPALPACRELAAASGVEIVRSAVEVADNELKEVFRSLGAEGG